MNALLLTAPSRLDYTTFPDPEPGDGEVLVRVRACGICGSDVHGWDGSTGRRRPPLIMGHEAAGDVVGLGPRVTRWRLGERVTFDSTVYCGSCAFCRAGRVNLCASREVIGVSPVEYKRHGAFAELVVVPERVLYRLPEAMGYEAAAMVEPVAVALHAVGRVTVTPETRAVVIGSGMIGLFLIQVLRWAGVKQVIAVDLSDERLALARKLGATEVLRSDQVDVAAAVAKLTGGDGADAAWEVVGLAATLELAINAVSRGGHVVMVGNLAPRAEFAMQAVVTRELTLHGSCSSAGEYGRALELIASGAVQVAPMVSAVASLAEGAAWFERLSAPGAGRFMKVILKPDGR